MKLKTRTGSLALAAALMIGALAGCSSGGGDEISLEDAWIKATDTDMTAMFGVLKNPTSEAITLVDAKVVEAGVVELHTVVPDEQGNMVMKAVEGGFKVEPGGSFVLEPGAEHIMLMDLQSEIAPGMHLNAELIFDNGQTLKLEVPAKEFDGADEMYHPDHGDHGDHGEDHGDERGDDD